MSLLAKKVTDLNDNILQQIMKEIKIKFIETCSNFQNMQKITNITNINSLQTIQKSSCRYTNRKILQKKFNEYFDFFNDYFTSFGFKLIHQNPENLIYGK